MNYYAGLMFIDILIFAVMARYYTYVIPEKEESLAEDLQLSDNINVIIPAFAEIEKRAS